MPPPRAGSIGRRVFAGCCRRIMRCMCHSHTSRAIDPGCLRLWGSTYGWGNCRSRNNYPIVNLYSKRGSARISYSPRGSTGHDPICSFGLGIIIRLFRFLGLGEV